MKNLISVILAACLLLSAFPFAVSAAESGAAVGETVTYGDYEGIVLPDETVKITAYNGSEAEVQMPSYIDGMSVSEVGDEIFRDCPSVKSVVFPWMASKIGNYCLNLNVSSVVLPTYLEEAPNFNEVIINITGREQVIKINDLVFFAYCDNCETAEEACQAIADGGRNAALVKYDALRDEEYYYDTGIKLLSLTNYSGNNKKITSLYIPDSINEVPVTEIGDNAFFDYENPYELESIKLPAKLEAIGNSALAGNKFSQIDLPDTVTSIGDDAFIFNQNLNSMYIPFDAVLGQSPFAFTSYPFTIYGYYGSDAERYCNKCAEEDRELGYTELNFPFVPLDSYGYARVSDGFGITGYYGDETDLTLPSEFFGGSVTEIGENAFNGANNLSSVAIPDSIVRIGGDAFYGCCTLGTIMSTDRANISLALLNVDSIGAHAFAHCTELENTSFELNAFEVGAEAFLGVALESVTIYKKDADIGSLAFGYEIDPPSGLPVKNSAFTVKGYTSSTSQTYAAENGFTFIPLDGTEFTYADYGSGVEITAYNINEKTVTVPYAIGGKTVLQISESAFERKSMNEVNLPYSLEAIGAYAFARCAKLAYVNFYEDSGYTEPQLREIDDSAFKSCESLIDMDITSCRKLTRIESCAFAGCKKLESFSRHNPELPDSLNYIGSYAFVDCPIYYVKIFNEELSIGEYAFGFTYNDDGDPVLRLFDGYYDGEEPTRLRGFKNSTAHTYCNEYGTRFIMFTRFGDADTNDTVNVNDATYTQKAIAKLVTLNSEQMVNADLNEDGAVNIIDVTIIQKVVAGLIDYRDFYQPKG